MMLTVLEGDVLSCLKSVPDNSIHMCATSPPYWGLRDYGVEGQIGVEPTPEAYVWRLVRVFREVRRVLRSDGTLWLNLGDSYSGSGGYAPNAPCNKRRANGDSWGSMNKFSPREGLARKKQRPGYVPPGLKPKDLIGIPWRVAFALQADGWWLRQDIIWHKPNPMPESATDRCTKAHEYVFLLSKAPCYFYDAHAVKEPAVQTGRVRSDKIGGNKGEATRNRRGVWTVATQPYPEAHFATWPEALVQPMILAGTSAHGCCPACGAPWERAVERERPPAEREEVRASDRDGGLTAEQGMEHSGLSHFKYAEWLAAHPARTVGWQPTCTCDPRDPVPCHVLDPFAGSGTTGAVALKLGRAATLIELNPTYVELIRKRCSM